MLVATGSMWLLSGHPRGMSPNLTLCQDGLDGVGIGPRSPGIQQGGHRCWQWKKDSPHPPQGFWKPDFLRSFSKTGPDKTHASSGDFSSGPVTACGHSPRRTASADQPDLLLT